MPLRSFSVTNYRSFKQEALVELRPLTLLFGHNNSGKSTLLRALPLLSESAQAETPEDVLAYRGQVTRGASFRELVCRLPETPAHLSFSLTWDDDSSPVRTAELTFRQMERLGGRASIIIEHIHITASSTGATTDLQWVEDPAPSDVARYRQVDRAPFPLPLRGLVPVVEKGDQAIAGLAERLGRLASGVSWVGSVRAAPKRSLPGDLRRPRRIWDQGGEAQALLVYDHQEQGPLRAFVSAWYEGHFARRLDVHKGGSGELSVMMAPLALPTVGVNLADCGEGIAQVLPVLVLCAQAQAGRIGADHVIALEQPELHLHTDAQRALASHLCEIAARPGSPRFLIETHSEIFLLQLQLEVLQHKLSADQALLYTVSMTEEGQSLVRRSTLDALGQPEGLPRIFGEGLDLAREIARLRIESKQ